MLCEGGSLGSENHPQLFWQAEEWGVFSCAIREWGCRIKPAGPGAGQAGPWGGGCTGKPLPIRTRGITQRGTGRMETALTGSPLMPRAPVGPSSTTVSPCTPKEERWG